MNLSFHLLSLASLGVAAAASGPKPKMVGTEVTSASKGNLFDPKTNDDAETLKSVNSVSLGDCTPDSPVSIAIGSLSGRGVVGARCDASVGIDSDVRTVTLTGDTQENFFNDAIADDSEFCGTGFVVEDEGASGAATVTCNKATEIVAIVRNDGDAEESYEATVTCEDQGGLHLELAGASASRSKRSLQGTSRAARAKGGPPVNPGKSPVAFENASSKGISVKPNGPPTDGDAGLVLVDATYETDDGTEIIRTFIAEASKCKPGKGPNGRRKLKSIGVTSSTINEDGDIELDFDLDALRDLLGEDEDARFKVEARIGVSASPEEELHEVVDMSAFLSVDEPKMVVHGGWIRRALSSKLGDNAPLTKWDVVVQEAVVTDPNDGYRAIAHMSDVHATGVGSDRSNRRARMLEASTDEERAISDEMRQGRRPVLDRRGLRSLQNGGKKILVHGYCSDSNPFTTSHFTNAIAFSDPDARRRLGGNGGGNNWSHDEFAGKISRFAAANGIDGCGIIAHSQGGAASLHLYTYYWSCLDYSTQGSRMIQSVGTPYRGTALAGNLAALGDVFGAGCGTNNDLTESGADSWLSGIPSWARSVVNYYTTSFATAWWRYDYCHLGTDLFLDDPEDGTVEKGRGQLSGGVNRGHASNQCHTSGMRDPEQTKDYGRNSAMNSYARY